MASSTPGVHVDAKGKKTFIPLENNPSVFTDLIHRLGVSPKLGFYDVYSISEPDLLSFIPRPCHALIFIAPADVYNRVRASDWKSKELTYSGSGEQEPVIWFRQTIGNACGLYALIHAIGNGSASEFVEKGSTIDELLTEALPLKPWPRADVFYHSEALEKAHMACAVKGDSPAPAAEDKVGYHFITFVKGKDGHLYELEGCWDGPIDRGTLKDDEDCLSESALCNGVKLFVDKAEGNMEFSIVALATKPEEEQLSNGA